MDDPLVPALGAIKSPTDYRDIALAEVSLPTTYPTSFFNDVSQLPVWHQHKLGACVGHAAAKYKQALDLKDTGTLIPLSARYLYAMAKCQDGAPGDGTFPRLVMKILKDTGCAQETTVPNDTLLDHETYVYQRQLSNIPLTPESYLAKSKGYAFVDLTIDGLKQAIVDCGGAILLMRIGQEWWTGLNGISSWQAQDILPLRPPVNPTGGHEVFLYGYEEVGNDTKFYILNSWSDQWGDHGKGYFMFNPWQPFLYEAITMTDIPNSLLKEVDNLPSTLKHTFLIDMHRGEINEEIKFLQTALKMTLDFPKEQPINGSYGPITTMAVKQFQTRNGIIASGMHCGPQTRFFLNKLYSN